MKSSWPIAFSIFFGFSVVAIAIYFGLAAQNSSKPIESNPTTVFKEIASDWERIPKSEPTKAVVAKTYKNTQEVARDRGVFRTTWRTHKTAVTKICKAHEKREINADELHLEVPIEMKIDPQGIVSVARRFTQPRILQNDGTAKPVIMDEKTLKPWTTCIIEEIIKRVKFPPGIGEDTLRVWVPISLKTK